MPYGASGHLSEETNHTMNHDEKETGIANITYNLIAVIHHTAEGTVQYDAFIKDAEEAGDNDCATFFRETQQAAKTTAEKAQTLLAKHLTK